MTVPGAGALLVAAPTLTDPNFFRSVVLLMNADEDGAVGVIINRMTDVPVREYLPDWCDLLAPPRMIFDGGPVRPETAIGVGVRPGVKPDAMWRPIPGGIGFIDVGQPPGEVIGVSETRIYAGYAGWGAGQLEAEMEIGSWFAVVGNADDVFDPVPGTLWRRILQRQEPHIARYANYPIDPRTN